MDETPHLAMPLLANKQALQTTFHDEAIKTLDALVMLSAIDRDLSSPPASPDDGDRYIVKAPGSGDDAWVDDNVVMFLDGHWRALPPRPGWTCYVQDEGALIAWDGTAWQPAIEVLGGAVVQNLALLGIGTTADASNPLAAKLNNALFAAKPVAEGGDGHLRYKLSKESAAKTLSFLFQDNFSGRAEIGLTGDDDFHVKVSADGSSWLDAIVVDRSTGQVALPNTASAGVARRHNVLTPHENLIVKWVGASTVDADADAVVLFNGSGVGKRFGPLNETLDITVSGANGRDGGSEASSTWYHIWAIGKADGTLDCLFSTSAASPTLPSGYAFKGYLGAAYNNASANLETFLQRGNLVTFTPTNVLTGGTSTSYATLSLAAAVPATATSVLLRMEPSSSSGTNTVTLIVAAAGSGSGAATYGHGAYAAANTDTIGLVYGPLEVALETPQQAVYRVAGTNARGGVTVMGWRF